MDRPDPSRIKTWTSFMGRIADMRVCLHAGGHAPQGSDGSMIALASPSADATLS